MTLYFFEVSLIQMTEKIAARVNILPKNSSDEFDDSWNFEISGFKFLKISSNKLEVIFQYEDDLVKEDEKFGKVYSYPGEDDDKLLEKEYELETLLDVITLHTGVGLRIDIDSYAMSTRSGSVHPTHKNINRIKELESIEERFTWLVDATDEVQDALRFYRLNKLEEDPGERSSHLWNILERLLYVSSDKKFLEKNEHEILRKFIEESDDIAEEKKLRLIEQIDFIQPIPMTKVMAEKLRLSDESGPVPEAKKDKMLKDWRRLRGYHGHGRYILRSENLDLTLWEIEDIVELILEDKIIPKRYLLLAYPDLALHESYNKSPSHYKFGGWNFIKLRRGNVLSDEVNTFMHTVREGQHLYLANHKKIYRIEYMKSNPINLEVIEPVASKELKKLQKEMKLSK